MIGLLTAGRFAEFFVRSDSETITLGLATAQWTSLLLMIIAAAGAWRTFTPRRRTTVKGGAS